MVAVTITQSLQKFDFHSDPTFQSSVLRPALKFLIYRDASGVTSRHVRRGHRVQCAGMLRPIGVMLSDLFPIRLSGNRSQPEFARVANPSVINKLDA